MRRSALLLLTLATLGHLSACAGRTEESVVNVYSHRHYDGDRLLFERFTEMTGIQVNVVTASTDELMTRLETEGEDSPADLLITVDASRLHRAFEKGLFQAVESDVLLANVPEGMRGPAGYWYGLTTRARIVVYAKDRVAREELTTYEDLATPKWKGRILVRSSENIYNQSLLGSIIGHHGLEGAREWAEGIVANMAQPPRGGDRDQVKAVAAGVGDVAIVNSYYVGLLFNSDDAEERALQEKVAVFFPNQDGRGAHVNVSGGGVTAHAPNKENAIRLLEFLTSEEAQRSFAQGNYEYPMSPAVEWAPTLKAWGEFKADTLDFNYIGELAERAVMIFDQAGWR